MGGRRAGEVPLPAVAFSPGKASRDTRLSLRFAVVPPPRPRLPGAQQLRGREAVEIRRLWRAG